MIGEKHNMLVKFFIWYFLFWFLIKGVLSILRFFRLPSAADIRKNIVKNNYQDSSKNVDYKNITDAEFEELE